MGDAPAVPGSPVAPAVRIQRSAGRLRQVIELPDSIARGWPALSEENPDPAHVEAVSAACTALLASSAANAFERDLTAVEALVADLGRDARLIVFFGGGVSSIANQAVAQFAGWNIPGVGEGDQRFRPRTRLYDTVDPDTLGQVRETLAYDRTSFVFTADVRCGAAVRLAAEVFLPALVSTVGADEAASRTACLIGAEGATRDRELAELVSNVGGRVIELRSDADVLPVADLATGLARAVDGRAMRRGALALIDEVSNHPERLLWPAVLARLAARGGPLPVHALAMADRLGAFSAWWAAAANAAVSPHGGLFVAGAQSMIGQDPAAIGLARAGSHTRAVDLHTVDWSHAAARETTGAAAQASLEEFSARALAGGHAVRHLILPAYDAESLGAAMALAKLECGVFACSIAAD